MGKWEFKRIGNATFQSGYTTVKVIGGICEIAEPTKDEMKLINKHGGVEIQPPKKTRKKKKSG